MKTNRTEGTWRGLICSWLRTQSLSSAHSPGPSFWDRIQVVLADFELTLYPRQAVNSLLPLTFQLARNACVYQRAGLVKFWALRKRTQYHTVYFHCACFGQGSELIPEGGIDWQNWNKLSQEVNTLTCSWFSLLTLAHIEVKGQFCAVILSFHLYVGPGDWTLSGLCREYLYLLRHLARLKMLKNLFNIFQCWSSDLCVQLRKSSHIFCSVKAGCLVKDRRLQKSC